MTKKENDERKYFTLSDILSGKAPGFGHKSFKTGFKNLDIILGEGVPLGRVIELFGLESSGKSTLALQLCAAANVHGWPVLYVDMEQALSPQYILQLGVDPELFMLTQPNDASEAFEIIKSTLDAEVRPKLIVVDSVAALVLPEELEQPFDKTAIALQARFLSNALKTLNVMLAQKGATVIFINQLRENITQYGSAGMVTPGGRALKFYSSIRIELKRIEYQTSYSSIQVRIVKNKVGLPYMETKLMLIHGRGFNQAYSWYYGKSYPAKKLEGGSKKRAAYEYKGKKYKGEADLLQAINSDEEFITQLKEYFRESVQRFDKDAQLNFEKYQQHLTNFKEV